MTDKALPVVILGGYLGAGKTTLLNRLLSERHGMRLAVVVNDFGAINVDAGLVQGSDGETIALTNGCLCCNLADGFIKVMRNLQSRISELDGVVVETSGVANPAQAAAYATLPGFRLAGVIVLADAERVQRLARDPLVGRSINRQLEAADMVLVTKGDLTGPEKVDSVLAWVKERLPHARVIASPSSEVSISLLFDDATPINVRAEAGPDEDRHDDVIAAYERGLARPRRPVSAAELRRWYEALPDGVLRVKGWVWLADNPDAPASVQGVGHRLDITTVQPGAPTPDPALILLGLPGSLQGVCAPDGTNLDRS
jgi:G3E family GTPase